MNKESVSRASKDILKAATLHQETLRRIPQLLLLAVPQELEQPNHVLVPDKTCEKA